MSFGELQIWFSLFVTPKIRQMTSYPETLSVDEDKDFCYEDILHFFSE